MGSNNNPNIYAEKMLSSLPQLLEDMLKLSEDRDTCDVEFLLGRDESDKVYGHKIIFTARCKSFPSSAAISKKYKIII